MKISTAKYGSYVPTFQQKKNTSTKYIKINIMYFIISVGTLHFCWNLLEPFFLKSVFCWNQKSVPTGFMPFQGIISLLIL